MATTTKPSTLTSDRSTADLLKVASNVLALIGLFIAGYLVWTEATNTQVACPQTGGFNCDLVQHSIYSRIGPIPVAVLGLIGYAAILLTLLFETRIPLLAVRGKLFVFGMALIGLVFSGYLTAMEAFVLHAWCIWCVASAITMTVLFILSFARLWRAISMAPEEAEE